jgi:hypothetical protein
MQPQNALRPETIASQLSTNTDDIASLVADALTFLKLDGSRAMTGNLDLAGNKLLTTDLSLKQYSGSWMTIMDRAGVNLRSIMLLNIQASNTIAGRYFAAYHRDSYLRSYAASDGEVQFQSHNGVAWQTEMSIINHGLRMPNLPAADPADGTSTLWMNPADRIVRVGT